MQTDKENQESVKYIHKALLTLMEHLKTEKQKTLLLKCSEGFPPLMESLEEIIDDDEVIPRKH